MQLIALLLALSGSNEGGHGLVTAPAKPVAELFTSQSCSSCPPAEAFFAELSERDDIVSLQWHVDYWNDLKVGARGRWRDPYSSPANTERQRDYNARLRHTRSVYTPQAVVRGAKEMVGSKRSAVLAALDSGTATSGIDFIFRHGPRELEVRISDATGAVATIEIIELIERATTMVGGGENAGKKIVAANVAVGSATGSADAALTIDQPPPSRGCAVLARDETGMLLGGAYCP